MIWMWIGAAVLLSWLLCKKQVCWYHYIWILLPIEMYGVSIAGAMIKPYMIFGALIVMAALSGNRIIRTIPSSFFMIVALLIFSDLLTGLIIASIMQHLMLVIILVIALCYVRLQGNGIALEQMGFAATATTIGYSIIFVFAYMLHTFNMDIGGVFAQSRTDIGIVMFASTGGVTSFRLRGFCIDPNAVVTTLIPGAAFSLTNILYRGRDRVRSIFAIIVFAFVVAFSGSRMGIICTLIMTVGTFIIGFRRTVHKRKWLLIAITLFIAVGLYVTINFNSLLLNISLELNDFFNSRASLTSEYGRVTIWKENLEYLFGGWKFIAGVGQNQIYLLSPTGLACHNTWLEWICGTGIIIGLIIDLWFLTVPISVNRQFKYCSKSTVDTILPFIMAYLTTIICITTIDNITNSILLFLLVIFRYGHISNVSEEE